MDVPIDAAGYALFQLESCAKNVREHSKLTPEHTAEDSEWIEWGQGFVAKYVSVFVYFSSHFY
jgi:hypothetical protein